MRHVFMPAQHTDEDLVLAGQLVTALDSAELYVTLTADGQYAAPTVPAAVRDVEIAEPAAPAGPTLFGVLMHRVAALVIGLLAPRQPLAAAPERPQLEPARS